MAKTVSDSASSEGVLFRRIARFNRPVQEVPFDVSVGDFRMTGVMAPETWSQTAVSIMAQKYFRKKGVPSKLVPVPEPDIPAFLSQHVAADGASTGGETSVTEVHHRLAGAWTYWGVKCGLFTTEHAAREFHANILNLLNHQAFAPNSPQYFNTGLHHAYGITGEPKSQFYCDPVSGEVRATESEYERSSVSACYISPVADSLVGKGGISEFLAREANIFRSGAGSGVNVSSLRGANEPLTNGGQSSGLMSFLEVFDRNAGAIKSGGTCLAPHQHVYTDAGPVRVDELAASGKPFVCLSYDPPANRYKAKWATARATGVKTVVRVVTDKGHFDVSFDHPMRLADGQYLEAGKLTSGQRLYSCRIWKERRGYIRIQQRMGLKKYIGLHTLFGRDLLGAKPGDVVHHRDGDKTNNLLTNLEIKTQSAHATEHGLELAATGRHIFQLTKFPKAGSANGMAAGSSFWANHDKVKTYKTKQAEKLRPRAKAMHGLAMRRKMLNTLWALVNAGFTVDTFEQFIEAREKTVGRVYSKTGVKRAIVRRFGSYDAMLAAANGENHSVVSVTVIGEMPVYDVSVDCSTPDTLTPDSGHNFVIWDKNSNTGLSVHNTRRAACMRVLDVDHPDIEAFIDWKVNEEMKVAAMVAGSRLMANQLMLVYEEAKLNPESDKLGGMVAAALADGIPEGAVLRAVDSAKQGIPFDVKTFDLGWRSEAYATVSGQNANNSVRVTDEFMRAVRDDADWHLYWRTELTAAAAEKRAPKPCRTVKARALWDKITQAAWACADPGIQFDTTINDWHTCPADGRIRGSNPCCLVGSTLVDTVEGRVRIDELVARHARGEELPMVYCRDTVNERPTVRRVLRAWKAGDATELVRITTDKGVVIDCTPEHRFLTFGGNWVEAQDLVPGVSLRKISRHRNRERRNVVMITDGTRGTASGTDYLHRWLWSEVHGDIPEDMEIHHRDEDCTNNRLSNLEARPVSDHRSEHAQGERNPNALDVSDEELARVWAYIRNTPPVHRIVGDEPGKTQVTVGRWNRYLRTNNLQGRVPVAATFGGGRIRGETWATFNQRMETLVAAGNDKVASVQRLTVTPTPVFDIEVEGVHNFAVSSAHDPASHSIIVHNSEYHFLDNTACNLASLNLCAFMDDDKFDFDSFYEAARVVQTVLDISVFMGQYPSPEMAQGAYNYRTTGIGYANLGAMLMRMGVPYDSDEGRHMAAVTAATLQLAALGVSADLARVLGPFPRYAANRMHVLRAVVNHTNAVSQLVDNARTRVAYSGLSIRPYTPPGECAVRQKLVRWADDVYANVCANGLRNAQVSVQAPTGCLVAGSLVLTDRGLTRIGTMGDPAGEQWQAVSDCRAVTDTGLKQVTKFFVNGVADVVKVTTENGYRLTGTPNHRVRVVDETGRWVWKQLGELVEGDRVPLRLGGMAGEKTVVILPELPPAYHVSRADRVTTPKQMTDELAALVGLFHAEGSSHEKGLRWSITAEDEDLTRWCVETCHKLFGVTPTVTPDGGCVSVSLNSTQLMRWWAAAGFAKTPGEKKGKGHTATLPDAVLATNDPEVYAGYLRGLFSGDGSLTNGLPSLSNASEAFIDDVRVMLLALGVVVRSNEGVGGFSGKPVYRLTAKTRRYARVFAETIGFLAGRKQCAITTDSGDDRRDYIPEFEQELDQLIPVDDARRDDVNRYRRNRGVPRRKATEFGMSGDGGRDPLAFFYDTVSTVELGGRQPTFDLSVPENVTYVANGFVSHNTISLVMDCDTSGIEPDFSLVKYKTLAGGGSLTLANQSIPIALRTLGYTDAQAARIVDFIQTTGTVEGAPELKAEHLPVFDCANKCGATGTRFISAEGHLKMLAAIQPFVSGGLSKTINLPAEASVEDVSNAYKQAWRLGIKAVALYRDGSKFSQPLTARLPASKSTAAPPPPTAPSAGWDVSVDIAGDVQIKPASVRRVLPDRRAGYTQKARIGGQKIYIRTGEYEDGTLGEIFLTLNRDGSTLRGMTNAFAIAVSLGLQHGVPLDEFVEAFVHTRFEPAGVVEKHKRIKSAASIVDLIFRELAVTYLGRDDLAQVGEKPGQASASPEKGKAAMEPELPVTPAVRYEPDPCTNCGAFTLLRTGACKTCQQCGTSSGCV